MSFSVFVDAGYLFKQGARAVLNARLGRHQVSLDGQRFNEELSAWICRLYPKDELLRTYWYDGARQGIATSDQIDVARLSFVKLRLGRINSLGQQKGVDTLIVRDLMILSQERSILRAVVLSGDEDLREGIESAQDRGVRVAVLGIEADGEMSQSLELVQEADESLVLPLDILERSLTWRPSTAVVGGPRRAVTVSHSAGRSDAELYVEYARQFAHEWLAKATAAEIGRVVIHRPKVPRPLDALMLENAAGVLGVRTISDDVRREMRAAFWLVVEAETETREA